MGTKILVFWHIAEVGNWRIIAPQQWWRLQATGLLDACDKLHVSFVGAPEPGGLRIGTPADPHYRAPLLAEHPKVEWWEHPDREQFEFPTLGRMHRAAVESPEPFHACYFHVKGAMTADHQRRNPAYWWQQYMEHHVLSGWRRCVRLLDEGHELLGCDIRFAPALHFSGNFFWATSEYLKRLPPMENYHATHRSDRVMAEMWHGRGNPKFRELQRNGPWDRDEAGNPVPSPLTGQDMYRYAMTPEKWSANE